MEELGRQFARVEGVSSDQRTPEWPEKLCQLEYFPPVDWWIAQYWTFCVSHMAVFLEPRSPARLGGGHVLSDSLHPNMSPERSTLGMGRNFIVPFSLEFGVSPAC